MNEFFEIIGRARVREICQRHGLTREDVKIVEEILDQWEGLAGETEKKIDVVLKNIGDNPREIAIVYALTEINIDFMDKKSSQN